MSLHPKYPNLELLEYKTIQFLYSDQDIKQALEDWKQEHRYLAAMELEADVFPQMWSSTCTGFDLARDGSPAIAGQAFTKEYTTIFHELHTDTYLVFFGERLCYLVNNASPEFFEDMKNRKMKSFSEAMDRY